MKDLPQRVRAYRQEKGLSAKAFGRIVGEPLGEPEDAQNVYAWERTKGKRVTPRAAVLFRFADLGIITIAERDELILRGSVAA